MALDTSKCNHLPPLLFKRLSKERNQFSLLYTCYVGSRQWYTVTYRKCWDDSAWVVGMCVFGYSLSSAADIDGGECRRRLFVGQLPSHTSEYQLRLLFAKFGRVVQLKITRDDETGDSTCDSASINRSIIIVIVVIVNNLAPVRVSFHCSGFCHSLFRTRAACALWKRGKNCLLYTSDAADE